MDDIYFNENHKNNRSDKPRSGSKDRFSNETPVTPQNSRLRDDELSDDKFVVHIPEEADSFFAPQSRTPKGRPVAKQNVQSSSVPGYEPQNGSDFYSSVSVGRTPAGKRVGSPTADSAQAQRRTPTGQRIGGTQNESNAARPYSAQTPPFEGSAKRMPSTAQNEPTVQKSRTAAPVQGKAQKSNKQPVSAGSGNEPKPMPKKSRKKRGKGLKIFVAVIMVIAILFGGVFAYGYYLLGKISYDAKSLDGNEYISNSKLSKSNDVRNILFMGSDARGDVSGQRSDTMILCSIDQKHKMLKLTSFLRDSYVFLPSGKYYNKLNATFSYGGVQYTVDTLEYNFKVKIDDYIIVDFEAFAKLIDMMGGLTVEGVTASEAKYLREKVKILYAKEGTNKFSGKATLWYCRIRYLDNDFKRTERQRKVISAMISQLTKTNPTKLFQMMETILPMIQTNISRNELISLGAGALFKYLHYDIIQHQIPADGTWNNLKVAGIGDVLEMDIDKNAELLKKFIYKSDKAVKAK